MRPGERRLDQLGSANVPGHELVSEPISQPDRTSSWWRRPRQPPPQGRSRTTTCAESSALGREDWRWRGRRNRYPVSAVEVKPPVRRSRICRNRSTRLPCRTVPPKQTVCRHRAWDGFVGHVGRLDKMRHSRRDAFVTKSLKVSDQRRRCRMPVPLESERSIERRVRCPGDYSPMHPASAGERGAAAALLLSKDRVERRA